MVALTVALVLGLAVGAGGWRALSAAQFNPQPEPPALQHFALVTLGAGQFARVNVAYAADPGDFRHPPDPGRVEIAFYDQDGRLLGETMETLTPGRGTTFEYRPGRLVGGDDHPPPDDGHLLVRARVRVLNRTRGAGIVSAMEIADAEMGTSRIVPPAVLVGFNPQPEPPARGGR
jgi:hypothetical protein